MFRTAQVIILAVIAFFVFAFLTRPLFVDIRAVQKELDSYKTAVAQASEFNQLLSRIVSEQSNISPLNRDRLNALLPTTLDPVTSLVDIQALASVHGMVVASAATASSEGNGASIEKVVSPIGVAGVNAEKVSLEILGTYDQFKAFLIDLEQSLPLVEVGSVNFKVADGDLTKYTMELYLPEWDPNTLSGTEVFDPGTGGEAL
ncbi:hypothetical protein COU16_02755 [Candidatus Kaiserbacteria bacterium CG10_big_fil_rev_8_21_14_0_10_47_16]|uniref:Type 4a pilus biogenesis protein PilO n=1 Tax=Candidatus Kaiserbacteria bacterium CG10_big_fil_rev_8_21_14_0_10_47_16 TaxID=1974608 RepID=A0A2H0UFB0_9BACT|nr:MAG: hypothetical protein COU16_02755 [Candidatus Kaiserbacteria bacterium CG10_big_fil_rev_8_21_14_0_10_47_16]